MGAQHYSTYFARGAEANDPLAAIRGGPGMAPLVDGFSLLAIITSYVGFVLGLTDFLSDLLQARLPGRHQHCTSCQCARASTTSGLPCR